MDEIQKNYYTADSASADGKALPSTADDVELADLVSGKDNDSDDVAMEIRGGTFSWATTAEDKAKKEEDQAQDQDQDKDQDQDQEHNQNQEEAGGEQVGGAPGTVLEDEHEGENAAEEPLKAAEEGDVSASDIDATKPPMVLNDLNLRVNKGELVAIVGRVGSGKTALCAAFLGELKKWSGNVTMKGSLAYIAQTPFILNETLRQNIVFGGDFDEALYKRAIKGSCLEHDLEALPNHDATEIGERGINLSGGQKARVSIARAVYSQADTLIFDDPLSALDAEVGHRIFDSLILEELANKTRLLVTNQLWCLERCDRIVVLGDDQRIAQQGTFSELMDSGLNFSLMMKEFGVADDEAGTGEAADDELIVAEEPNDDEQAEAKTAAEAEADAEVEPDSPKSPKIKRARSRSASEDAEERPKADALKAAKGKLSDKEDREKGAVSNTTYSTYVTAAHSKCLFSAAILALLTQQAMDKFHQYWIAYWSDNLEAEDLEWSVSLAPLPSMVTPPCCSPLLTIPSIFPPVPQLGGQAGIN